MDLLGKASALASTLASKAKAAAMNMTEIELKMMEATNLDPWGPHGTLMSEIAQASYDSAFFTLIMNIAEQRLQCTGAQWRHVYKTLLVLEFMAKRGPMRVVEYIQSLRSVLEKLRDNFDYKDENGRDQGINVRERSKQILVLVFDEGRLRQERDKASANTGKYTGVSSATTPSASPSATPRSLQAQGSVEDDALEATRMRIERLKATGALPDAPGLFEDPAPKKTTKKLSEVKVNPVISAGLTGLGPPPAAGQRSTAPSSAASLAPQPQRPAVTSQPAAALDLLSDFSSPPKTTSTSNSFAPPPQQKQQAARVTEDDWCNFSSAPAAPAAKPAAKIDIESMLNLDAEPPSKNSPLPMEAFSAFPPPTVAPPARPAFVQPPLGVNPTPGMPAAGFGFGPPHAAAAGMGHAQASPSVFDPFDPFAAQATAAPQPVPLGQAPNFAQMLLPQSNAPKPEKPKLGPETSVAAKKKDPFADLLSF